jgi:adenylate cyclase
MRAPLGPLLGLLGLAALAAAGLLWLPDAARARYFDHLMMALPPPAPAQEPLVIDIGAQDETGAPWGRAASARLVARVAAAGPRAIGLDILFAGDCDSPATADLAQAMRAGPSVTGFLLLETPLTDAAIPGTAHPIAVALCPDGTRNGPAPPCPA